MKTNDEFNKKATEFLNMYKSYLSNFNDYSIHQAREIDECLAKEIIIEMEKPFFEHLGSITKKTFDEIIKLAIRNVDYVSRLPRHAGSFFARAVHKELHKFLGLLEYLSKAVNWDVMLPVNCDATAIEQEDAMNTVYGYFGYKNLQAIECDREKWDAFEKETRINTWPTYVQEKIRLKEAESAAKK